MSEINITGKDAATGARIILTKHVGQADAEINIIDWSASAQSGTIQKEIDLFLQCAKQLNSLTKMNKDES